MSRESRHRLLQRIFWHAWSRPIVRTINGLIRRWEYVVCNRSLHSDTNGEAWLLTLLPEAPLVIDVGFNTGEFAAGVLTTRPAARVIGFDPAKEMRKHFERLRTRHPTLEFEAIALSDRPGRMTFFDTGSMSSSLADRGLLGTKTTAAYEVSVDTLDHYVASRGLLEIDLIKIDAEGFDLNVLEGAVELLRAEAVSLVMFEYADGWIANGRLLAQAAAFVAPLPYRLFRLFNGFLVPLDYGPEKERFDLGCMIVAVSERRLAANPPPLRTAVA